MTKSTYYKSIWYMAGDSTVILAQNAVTDIARALGYREGGIYFIISLQIVRAREAKRLDGIMASISFGDIVIFSIANLEWLGV